MVCWVPRARRELAAQTVTRNKVAMGFNSLDKMFQLQRNMVIKKIFWLMLIRLAVISNDDNCPVGMNLIC